MKQATRFDVHTRAHFSSSPPCVVSLGWEVVGFLEALCRARLVRGVGWIHVGPMVR